jgi:hypothetical protein
MALQFHAEIGAKLGKKALAAIATVAQPGTMLAWNRKCADHKVETSKPPMAAHHRLEEVVPGGVRLPPDCLVQFPRAKKGLMAV